MKKILLVNSLIVFNEKNKGLLNRSDFQVFTAVTGMEALQIHRKERVDLIIADLNMPGMGGDKLCSLVRTEKELRNVSILLACRDTPEELEMVAQSAANASITKPINTGDFLEKIGQLLAVPVRKDYRVLLKAKVLGNQESVPFFCTSYNISASGILIETDRILNQGDCLTCTFFLPGASQIAIDGEAVRSMEVADGSYHYGIRFIDLAPEYRKEIERFVASLAQGG
jgi:CheY-like chemotaxis protein